MWSQWTVQHPHLCFDAGGTQALGGPAQQPVVWESRPEMSTACTPGRPLPLERNAETKSPMPCKPAVSLIALLAGTLKNGSR